MTPDSPKIEVDLDMLLGIHKSISNVETETRVQGETIKAIKDDLSRIKTMVLSIIGSGILLFLGLLVKLIMGG